MQVVLSKCITTVCILAGIKLQGAKDIQYVGALTQLEELILAFAPTPAAAANPEHVNAVRALSRLTKLRRLDVFDTSGLVKLTQGLMEVGG